MITKINPVSSNNQMRWFVLLRVADLSGVSGTGEVAE